MSKLTPKGAEEIVKDVSRLAEGVAEIVFEARFQNADRAKLMDMASQNDRLRAALREKLLKHLGGIQ